jgi:hypothetical protein
MILPGIFKSGKKINLDPLPWINIINGRLKQGECTLSMTDSTKAKGWMRKSNFDKHSNDPIQAMFCVNAARHHAQLFTDAEVMGYSQWFTEKWNNVVDALSQDWHSNDNKLTLILRFHFPKQMQKHFQIAPIPNKINSWLTSLLQHYL